MNELRGARVVVTRAVHQARKLTDAFEDAGARVELLPLLEVAAPEDPAPFLHAIHRLERWDWIVFTSSNAVRAFFEHAQSIPATTRIAVVGPATEEAVRLAGAQVDHTAKKSDAEGLVTLLLQKIEDGERVLVPQAEDARPLLVDGLLEAAVDVTPVIAYRKRLPGTARDTARRLFYEVPDAPIGRVTFTSPRIVRHFVALLKEFEGEVRPSRLATCQAISIGPVTAAALREEGFTTILQAHRPTPEEMVRAARTPQKG